MTGPVQETEGGKRGLREAVGKAAGHQRIFYTWLRVGMADEAGTERGGREERRNLEC